MFVSFFTSSVRLGWCFIILVIILFSYLAKPPYAGPSFRNRTFWILRLIPFIWSRFDFLGKMVPFPGVGEGFYLLSLSVSCQAGDGPILSGEFIPNGLFSCINSNLLGQTYLIAYLASSSLFFGPACLIFSFPLVVLFKIPLTAFLWLIFIVYYSEFTLCKIYGSL